MHSNNADGVRGDSERNASLTTGTQVQAALEKSDTVRQAAPAKPGPRSIAAACWLSGSSLVDVKHPRLSPHRLIACTTDVH